MKKLIAVVTMVLAFTISAQAQDKKAAVNVNDAAQKDVAALLEKVTVDQTLKQDMYTLMVMKHEMLADAKSSADKQKVSEMIEHKILSGVSKEQRQTLTSNPELLKQLTH
jgi:exopolyphosphatase/pppGpp-phosphohydrolase